MRKKTDSKKRRQRKREAAHGGTQMQIRPLTEGEFIFHSRRPLSAQLDDDEIADLAHGAIIRILRHFGKVLCFFKH